MYGETFDVKTTEKSINIAYTSLPLELHTDLVYYESPPGTMTSIYVLFPTTPQHKHCLSTAVVPAGIQMLHCLRFDDDVVGGISTFTDAFHAAARLRAEDPEAYSVLSTLPASFQKVRSFDARESIPIDTLSIDTLRTRAPCALHVPAATHSNQ